jgi:O-antigen ligase
LSRFFGVGLGNFLIALPQYYPHRDIFFLQPVHNIYLLLLSETGIIGLGVTLFCFYLLFKHKMRNHTFSIWHLAFGILLLLGFVDHYPLTLQQGQLLLAFLLSLTFVNIKDEF